MTNPSAWFHAMRPVFLLPNGAFCGSRQALVGGETHGFRRAVS
ncbi:hypothetical protein TGS27_0858 [Geobacillus stearothermophilus]|uniref:Uncharacterized protein n=1 Tax=Geobacillus stearothermophilus TaxID=1422 RepID=A0ABQ7HH61_GEOSE|nr:hypothetical protein GS8_1138 [Geobacillus stearothermophilus]OAO84699.1 hypothetical protein TGS27_0858 [Geobacillus stearothermophilus]